MPLATLPLTPQGPQISRLGLGTVKWGRNQNVKYPAFELPTDAAIHDLLDTAQSCGVNYLDVAPAYGIAEERVGRILAERAATQFLVFTKTGEEFVDGVSHFDFSAAHTRHSVQRSLQRLKRDTLDAVQIHCAADDVHTLRETPVLETLRQLQHQGLVRWIGVSTMTVPGGLLAAEYADFLMVPYSIGYRDHAPVIARACELGRGVLIKRALFSGPYQEKSHTLQQHMDAVWQVPGVTSIVAGTLNPRHLQENAAACADPCIV
jgi:aryl-alcohol dehydrogenase-like predicted oxidoreductase